MVSPFYAHLRQKPHIGENTYCRLILLPRVKGHRHPLDNSIVVGPSVFDGISAWARFTGKESMGIY
jgi:hypothetical protein